MLKGAACGKTTWTLHSRQDGIDTFKYPIKRIGEGWRIAGRFMTVVVAGN